MLPYEQGYLDGLCGVYSVINATRLIVRNMTEKEAMRLFGQCLKHVGKRKSLSKVSTEGIDGNDLWMLLKVIRSKYPITVERPFLNKGTMSWNAFIGELRKYLRKDGKRSAIVYMECKTWDHWSAVESITGKRIKLFDSALIKTVNIDRCVVRKPTKANPYLFDPELTFYLWEK